MRVTKRRALAAAALATGAFGVTTALASGGGGGNRTVDAVGAERVQINQGLRVNFKFAQDHVTVHPGDTVTWRNRVSGEEPHTVTIAASKAALPSNLDEVFNCGAPGTACEPAAGHVDPDFNPIPGQEVLNAGPPGLDEVGDSLLLMPPGTPGDTISAVVSAPAGTTLYYVCAVHAWMQGSIRVR